MESGICLLSVAPVRREPSHKSEMVNQMLFGDMLWVLERHEQWYHVKLQYDDYQGWVAANQVYFPDDIELQALSQPSLRAVSLDLIQVLEDKTQDTSFAVGAGCSFPFFEKGRFSVAGKVYNYPGEVFLSNEPDYASIVSNAMTFLNTPYLWGGRSPFGIDCSGLTQLAFKMSGMIIPRDAYQQAQSGQAVHLINEAQPGDLLFFDNHLQEINHVGILVNQNHVIHAHGKVRIDLVDHHGIFNRELKRYTHPLRIIKRITDEHIKKFG
jgi:gamma-D-glutamyl-L-lysine dipeptidyl-peptidase